MVNKNLLKLAERWKNPSLPAERERKIDKITQGLNKDISDYVFVPSLKLYVAKQRTLQGKNWFDSHKELQKQGLKMPTIPEFIQFLKYLRENPTQENTQIYNDITKVRSPWRSEWLDADFKVIYDKLHINYNHILDSNKTLIPQNSEPLDKNTLMKDRTPGISLEDWLQNPTKQGFPTKSVKDGSLYYWYPRSNNNSVARFVALGGGSVFDGNRNPSGRDSDIGVRAVRHK